MIEIAFVDVSGIRKEKAVDFSLCFSVLIVCPWQSSPAQSISECEFLLFMY